MVTMAMEVMSFLSGLIVQDVYDINQSVVHMLNLRINRF